MRRILPASCLFCFFSLCCGGVYLYFATMPVSQEDSLKLAAQAGAQTILDPRRSKLLRLPRPVRSFSVDDPQVIDIVQFSSTEFEIIGSDKGGTASITFHFADGGISEFAFDVQVARYTWVTWLRDQRSQYGKLQNRMNELFPNSDIVLIWLGGDTLLITGTASREDAPQIIDTLAAYTTDQVGGGPGFSGRRAKNIPKPKPAPIINLLIVGT